MAKHMNLHEIYQTVLSIVLKIRLDSKPARATLDYSLWMTEAICSLILHTEKLSDFF